jgi:multidrug efflux pump subunit AcrB
MNKRHVAVLALVVILAVTAVAFAAVPSGSALPASDEGVAVASLRFHTGSYLADPVCPPPDTTGSGGC